MEGQKEERERAASAHLCITAIRRASWVRLQDEVPKPNDG
ncbi:hypothetical protein EGR_11329 [Echinococcus granulosus]|uniref:Uncharacterized protein n=1 Tax=Echinococcus granulosus TaxID=6210 RepID=W6U661_ECHGR|nr:hypothetical protein EGR_11329 [Echinococcus granulosus]EUB53822.1 hypothetical protein EGR_11329 [Echinococcus granulosus]